MNLAKIFEYGISVEKQAIVFIDYVIAFLLVLDNLINLIGLSEFRPGLLGKSNRIMLSSNVFSKKTIIWFIN
jgi:hypothetical protein